MKQLGTEEIDFEKQYWDRKNSHKNFLESFEMSKVMHLVSFHCFMKVILFCSFDNLISVEVTLNSKRIIIS